MTIALWCLFIAGLLHAISKIPLAQAQLKSPQGYNNSQPREQQAVLEGWGQRALAAHKNQIESFPLFAAGVLLAVATGVTSSLVDYLAIIFIICRLAYLYSYLNDLSTLRSTVWTIGYFCSMVLLCSPLWG